MMFFCTSPSSVSVAIFFVAPKMAKRGRNDLYDVPLELVIAVPRLGDGRTHAHSTEHIGLSDLNPRWRGVSR